jgi:hypothetical protein
VTGNPRGKASQRINLLDSSIMVVWSKVVFVEVQIEISKSGRFCEEMLDPLRLGVIYCARDP